MARTALADPTVSGSKSKRRYAYPEEPSRRAFTGEISASSTTWPFADIDDLPSSAILAIMSALVTVSSIDTANIIAYALRKVQGLGFFHGTTYRPMSPQTVTATSLSVVTQTSEVTSIAPTVTSATVCTTADTTAETPYGALMAVFLALFLATLVLLVGSRYRRSKGSNPRSSQAAPVRPAQARCGKCNWYTRPSFLVV